jgi:carbonic anhydrase
MDIYNKIFENNKEWVAKHTASDKEFFEKLAKEQTPDFLYIGCADSRIPANEIMGLEPGDVFVHRNVANLVVNTDLNVHSVIEYAVSYLKVKHIIVCGHYGCGGIKAAMLPQDMGLLNKWLRNIRDVYRLHEDELEAITDVNARYDRLVELNVVEQALNVIKTSFVQKAYDETGYPIVHGWVYKMNEGLLKDLNIDFKAALRKVKKIYNITGKEVE